MALNSAAAAVVATNIVNAHVLPPQFEYLRPDMLAHWTMIVEKIFAGIVANGVVLPTALVAPNGPVTGVGSIT